MKVRCELNINDYLSENKTEPNLKWSYIPYHPYRILKIGDSGPGKINALLNLINNQPDIDSIFVCKRSLWSKISISY